MIKQEIKIYSDIYRNRNLAKQIIDFGLADIAMAVVMYDCFSLTAYSVLYVVISSTNCFA